MRRDRKVRSRRPIATATLLVLAAGLVFSGVVRGHGAVIRLGAQAVAAGDSLAVTGEGLGENAEITLALEGATGRVVFASLRGDVHGRFTTRVLVPAETPPGTYRVVATAGEDRATAELLVTQGSVEPAAAGPDGLHAPEAATAAELDLDRRRTPLETALAWGTALVLLGLGGLLLRSGGREGEG